MVAEVTDIKGIGPAKAETLAENGYENVEDLAEADPDELAEVDGVGGDRALEFIVGAEDVLSESKDDSGGDEPDGESFDLTPSEVGEELEDDSEAPESDVSASDDEDEAEGVASDEADEEPPVDAEDEAVPEESYEVVFDFENQMQYDVFHAALMRHNERVSHQPALELMEKCLAGLYGNEQEVTYQFDEYELNTLHAAVKQARTGFQGANDIDQMDALKVIEAQIDDARSEHLF